MSVLAKCHNHTGCLMAYRGEEIPLANGAPMICPECGQPLTTVPQNAQFLRILPWAIFFGIIAVGAVVALPLVKNHAGKGDHEGTPGPTPQHRPTTTPYEAAAGTPAYTRPGAAEEPAAPIVAPEKIELNPESRETKSVREEVLRRIDLMPNISSSNKDKLYNSVQRARSMGLVLTLPFASSRTTIAGADIPALKAALDKPAVMKLREDPTAVFVVLGYADPKGDEKKNLRISQERADSVISAMSNKCGVANVSHAVPMGGTTLHDAKALEKNRIVEIWAVLP